MTELEFFQEVLRITFENKEVFNAVGTLSVEFDSETSAVTLKIISSDDYRELKYALFITNLAETFVFGDHENTWGDLSLENGFKEVLRRIECLQ